MPKNTYPWDLIDALTPRQYAEALLKIKINDDQRRMLCVHCKARHRTMTTKQLARAAGLAGHRLVNPKYGWLARRLWKQLRLPSPPKVAPPYGKWIGLLGAGPIGPGGEWEMKMHLSLATAVRFLKQKGWCDNKQGRHAASRAAPDAPQPHWVGGAGGGFGNAEQNARVEQRAVLAVKRYYRSRGWAVESKEAEKPGPGYDLLCSRSSVVHHVEVKGIKGPHCSFVVTANEKQTAEADPEFWLIAVTRALDAKRRNLSKFTGLELLRKFRFAPLSFMARRR